MTDREKSLLLFEKLKPYFSDGVEDNDTVIDPELPDYLSHLRELNNEWFSDNKVVAWDTGGYFVMGIDESGMITAWKPTGATWVLATKKAFEDFLIGDDIIINKNKERIEKIREIIKEYFNELP